MTQVDPALYAPQARLIDLASGHIIGTNVTSGAESTIVSADLLSVRVTLPNTGIAQLTVTLNNQRFVNGQPVFPPWKFNDFSRRPVNNTLEHGGTFALTFGQRIRLDVRYTGAPWVKMIVARITDLQFSFPASGAAQLQVTAEDMLSGLKFKPRNDIPYNDQQEEDIAGRTVTAAGLTIPVRTEGIEERSQNLRSARHQKSQTYFQFLSEIADRLDCELYVDFVDHETREDRSGAVAPGSIDVATELEIRMEPARSKRLPETRVTDWRATELGAGEYLELRWGKSLIDFKPKLKIWEMPTSATVSGSHPDRRGRARGELTSDDVRSAIDLELPRSPSYDVAPMDALTARSGFFTEAGDAEDNAESSHGSGLDETRSRIKALAAVMKKVRQFTTVEGSTVGMPLLRPGSYVHILGLRPPFDGFYYVTQTVHSLDGSGYRTQFSLRRPGMLPPNAYLMQSTEESAAASAGGTP